MPQLSNAVIGLFHKRATVANQGGLLNGQDPTQFNSADPIRLWIIQLGIIVCTATLLSLVLRKMRQPKVIAEVLGGIILGPTALGRIPGFTEHIFPQSSRPYLSLVAEIGLCLFLFLVGLEIDSAVIRRNARLSAIVALPGMIIPFGLGSALAVPLYHQFIDPSIKFTYFMLFTGVAYSITAFPVLCRILTELKLLDTTVGIVVLSAGVANDIIGWVLLALSVALVNAGSGLTALWILLCCVAWTLVLLFPGKIALKWVARKTGSIESGPTVFFMTVTILLMFASAFFTDAVGVQAIFGAFLVGLIVPREGGLAIALTEKLEDMVSIIFLPLYFTLSGLSTDLGLLNDGITWGYTIAIMTLAFTGKFGGCTLSARFLAGFGWREASAIGSLMSCKGLVELIVLNVGLSAGILTPRVFSMFVLEALVLTFMTTPLVTYLYPAHLRTRATATGPNFNNVTNEEAHAAERRLKPTDGVHKTRFTVVLDKLEHLPGMMALTQLLLPNPPLPRADGRTASSISIHEQENNISIEALRLIELSDRVSAVMKSSVSDALLQTDPILSVFRMFGQLNDMKISPAMAIIKYDELAHSVTEHAASFGSDMIMLPWLPPTHDAFDGHPHSPAPHHSELSPATSKSLSNNPFDLLFRSSGGGYETPTSAIHSQFVRGVFAQAKTDVALFIDQTIQSTSMTSGSAMHLFLAFFGGPDDRLALEFVVQICSNPRVTATVARLTKRELEPPLPNMSSAHLHEKRAEEPANLLTMGSAAIPGFPDTVYGHANTEIRLQSETVDNVVWGRYAASTSDAKSSDSSSALKRIEFKEQVSPVPLHFAIQEAKAEAEKNHARLLMVAGRSRRLAVENHGGELKELMSEHEPVGAEVRKTIGDVATAFVVAGCGSGIIVLQATASDS